VVNMSLGGPPSDGIDPLSDALTQITDRTGTLFVVAAGNEGAAYTVGSPGLAPAALTVGAVDRDETLAEFSSRGPTAGDLGLKPEITAPGVGIVAARATGTTMGSPVDALYTAASGTSMATPHVAGAAALLAQQNPDWSGRRLKDALISTAEPNPELGVYAQGGGRVDVARAVNQTVTASGIADFATVVDGDDASAAKRRRKLQPTRAAAGASPLATAAPAAAYYPVIADPLLQGTGGAAISVPSGLAPITASGAPQGLVPVFAVPAAGSPGGGGNRMIPQATAVWMVPQPGAAAGGAANQPTQFWAIQSAPQLINLGGAQTAVFPAAVNVADFQHQHQPISSMSHNGNSEQLHLQHPGSGSHEQQRGNVDHPEEDDDDDDDSTPDASPRAEVKVEGESSTGMAQSGDGHRVEVEPDPFLDGDDSGTEEEQAAFMAELERFHREHSLEFKPPKFYGKGLNCLKCAS